VDNLKLRNIHIPSWQALGAYVPQTINFLNNDVIHNVAFGIEDKDIDIDKVWESIKAAQLEELVLKMPNNIYTNLGDNGIQISGGQRQRLAIARALYRDAKFIILDEATSALDNKTESEVMGAIENIGKRCTIVIIAHRLSTVMQADNIYEFSEGKIKAFGNFRVLQEKSDSFKQLTNYEKYFKKDKNDIF
jgi:ATP-binding cassette subfamily B protein